MKTEDTIKAALADAELELLMRRFAMAPEGEARGRAKQAAVNHFIKLLDKGRSNDQQTVA